MLAFIKSIFSAIGELFSFLSQNQLVQAGIDKVTATQATKDKEIVIQAEEARDAARAAASAIPDDVSLPDDGFRRD